MNKKTNNRIKKLIVLVSVFAIFLTVSTYAWFIGMKTVNVNSFDVEIATTEGLFLSMDGVNWKYNLDAKNTEAYTGNANEWLVGTEDNPKGLIPMSTVGDMDATASRMMLYEKGSMTATTGGYRLLTSRVNNYTNKVATGAKTEYVEGNGYVAFDLFIRNLSGHAYYSENNVANEEAIYLTYDSSVTVGSGGNADAGIENSVRVAFAQIGRVEGTTEEQATITGITCSSTEDEDENPIVTGICRDAQIWEPNDAKHVNNAVSWYQKSCLKRDTEVTNAFTYLSTDNTCGEVGLTAARETYAVARAIGITDYVDIYDGSQYNGFTANVADLDDYKESVKESADNRANFKLVNYDYFTDTEKMEKGNKRIPFMTLAPNSITKVRVYIYIEGQDIDNYDFASLGKQISVKFGFTKERYDTTDIDYNGPGLEQGVDPVTPEPGEEDEGENA